MSDLKSRAHGKEVDRKPEGPTMQSEIREMQDQFQMAMPKGVEAVQLVRDALTALRITPGLLECEPKSVLGGLMTCAQLGLRLGVLGHAWLIPFWDNKSGTKKAQLVLGYQGLAELGYRSDRVAGISARTVHENDPVFTVEYGTTDEIIHRPNLDGELGRAIAYYCVVHIKGGRPIFVVMSHVAMEKYRDDHATARRKDGSIFGPWIDNFEGMAHKTCLRQLAKWMPKSTELATALVADEGVRVDLNPENSGDQATHHFNAETGEVIDGDDTNDNDDSGGKAASADDWPPAEEQQKQEGKS